MKKFRGFTIVEMSIAAFILVLFLGGIYKLFSSINRAHSMGSWVNATTIEIRNGLNLLRHEISRATPPKMVTQQGSEDFGTPDYKKFYYPSKGKQDGLKFPRPDASPPEPLLKFFMCQPGRKNIVGEIPVEPEIIQGSLVLKGNSLVYSRTIISQDSSIASKTPIISQIICRNVHQITLEILGQDDGITPTPDEKGLGESELSVKKRNFIRIHLSSIHPRYGATKVEETMEAPFEVAAEKDGKLYE